MLPPLKSGVFCFSIDISVALTYPHKGVEWAVQTVADPQCTCDTKLITCVVHIFILPEVKKMQKATAQCVIYSRLVNIQIYNHHYYYYVYEVSESYLESILFSLARCLITNELSATASPSYSIHCFNDARH